MISRQNQEGGDNSANMQAEQIVVHFGIDEKRAREICHEITLQLRRDYSQEAFNIANTRVIEFENRLMPKIAQVEGGLQAFADPGFQLLLVEAQKTAASTEREADYDLLSELLIHRFKKGEDRIARSGISLAVEIVDKVSDDALLALTVAHAVNYFTPVSGDIHQGLDALNGLFGKIINGELPSSQDWIDHLDILKAVRLNQFGSLKKIEQYYPEQLLGYVNVGIKKNSEDHDRAIELLTSHNIPTSILVEHVFNADFLRLCICNKSSIDRLLITNSENHDGRLVSFQHAFSEEQKQVINSLYELHSGDENEKQKNTSSFMIEWNKRSSLRVLKEWWDSIPTNFTITSVGKVLAHSNAQRCDKTLPPLD